MVHRDIKSRNVFLCRTWFWPHFPFFLFFPARAGCQVPYWQKRGSKIFKAKCIPRPPFFYTQKMSSKSSVWWLPKQNLVGGFKDFLFSPRKLGEDSQFDSYFSKGLKPPTRNPQGPAVRSWVTLVWYAYWSPPVTWHTPVWERPTTSVLSFLDKNHQGREVEHSSQLITLLETNSLPVCSPHFWVDVFPDPKVGFVIVLVEGRGLCFRMFQKSRLPGAGSPDSHPCTTCQDHPQTALQLQDRCLESRGVAIWNGSTETSLYGNLGDLAQDHHQRRCLVNLFPVMVCNL